MTSETTSGSLLTVLDAEHPEWRPLLAVIKEALREAERPQWARFEPKLEHSARGGRPLLDGAVINVAPRLVGRWVRHILAVATAATVWLAPTIGAGQSKKPGAEAARKKWVAPRTPWGSPATPGSQPFPSHPLL